MLEEKIRNDVWPHGGAGRGPKMDVGANKSKDEKKTAVKQKMRTMYKTRQPELLRGVTIRYAHNRVLV